jgi:hypothetical protein
LHFCPKARRLVLKKGFLSVGTKTLWNHCNAIFLFVAAAIVIASLMVEERIGNYDIENKDSHEVHDFHDDTESCGEVDGTEENDVSMRTM